ncbi:serine hydrolase [Pseudoxanthomonas suwonensis]|uniref:serine hydrolase n=1 Tax=Pseudoxanthomonas suwonensis TaxID=314722 RepID=UPI000698E6C0|nr:serine hydrolase [Pseudoxanthomonas suwonensis]
MRHTIIGLLLAIAAFFPTAALAAPPTDAEVARYARSLLEQSFPDPAATPGMAVLVARGDRVLYRDARGTASLELGVPLAPDQVFRIGSVTKQFAAAGVLKLVEEGKVALDDPLAKYVPGYPGAGQVSVRMLLNHTSGIRSYTGVPGVMDGPIRQDLATAQLIDTFKDEKPDFEPGKGFRYNNSGYVLAGAVIEAASGMPWHQYLDQALFQPLGLARTGYGNQAVAVIPGHVTGYTLNGGQWAHARHLSMTQPHAAGALVSTVDDLLKWNRALHGGRVLKAETYRQMIEPFQEDEPYGFGIVHQPFRGAHLLQHGGGIFGFSSYLAYVPDAELTVAVLYNGDARRPPMPGTGTFAHRIAAYAIGRPYPEKKAVAVDVATLASYEGVYRIDKDTARVLRVVDGRLTSQRTGSEAFALIPIGGDQFLFEEGLSRIAFERDAVGKVTAMRFFPDDEGEGEVTSRSDEPLPAARTEVELPAAVLQRLVGRYSHQGRVLTVALADGRPTAQLAGQPAFEIFAESPTRFFLKVVDAALEFAPGEAPASGVTLHQGGKALEYARVVD